MEMVTHVKSHYFVSITLESLSILCPIICCFQDLLGENKVTQGNKGKGTPSSNETMRYEKVPGYSTQSRTLIRLY